MTTRSLQEAAEAAETVAAAALAEAEAAEAVAEARQDAIAADVEIANVQAEAAVEIAREETARVEAVAAEDERWRGLREDLENRVRMAEEAVAILTERVSRLMEGSQPLIPPASEPEPAAEIPAEIVAEEVAMTDEEIWAAPELVTVERVPGHLRWI